VPAAAQRVGCAQGAFRSRARRGAGSARAAGRRHVRRGRRLEPDSRRRPSRRFSAASRDELLADARAHVAAHPADFVWIVYDGARENSCADGRVRVSYTGGTGPQRADDFIVDFVRMARWLGLADRIKVVTCDRKLLRRCTQAGAPPHAAR